MKKTLQIEGSASLHAEETYDIRPIRMCGRSVTLQVQKSDGSIKEYTLFQEDKLILSLDVRLELG